MREIITLQLGEPSNHLATHFWNAQESYFTYSGDKEPLVDHDVHWRPGVGADGSETFLPRTIIYDLKGGFGSLRKINALYEDTVDATTIKLWTGQQVIEKMPTVEQTEYQKSLDSGMEPPPLTTDAVRYWSDFSRVYFHPKSIVQLNEYDVHSSLNPFEQWLQGEELFTSLNKEHDLLDRDLRPFIEEADSMQGIQLFASLDDAWSGFAAKYLEELRDEYGKSTIWTWGLQDPGTSIPREKLQQRLATLAKGIVNMSQQTSLLLPLSLPKKLPAHVVLDRKSLWHTTSLLSAAVETATLPSRLRATGGDQDTLSHMTEILTSQDRRKLASVRLLGVSDSWLDLCFNVPGESGLSSNSHWFAQLVCRRGDNPDPVLDDDLLESTGGTIQSYSSSIPFPIPDSFPRVFSPDATFATNLATERSMSTKLLILKKSALRYISLEDRESVGNDLSEIADEYQDGWSSGSDEDYD